MPELRQDPVVGRWVILAPERAERPYGFLEPPAAIPSQSCPFCPGRESETPPEIVALRPGGGPPDSPGWTMRVVPNRFPALLSAGEPRPGGEGPYSCLEGFGAHEVLIETPEHAQDLATLAPEHVAAFLALCRQRMEALGRDPRIRHVLIFKNHGAPSGASLEHPHAQLIATPILPKQVAEEMEGGERYFARTGRCVFCEMGRHETEGGGRRLVLARDGYTVLEPYAPRFPFETWILPRAHASAFERGDRVTDLALAGVLGETLRRLDRVVARMSYNFVLHSAPCRSPELPHYHWHMEILPRLVEAAGFEWGSGFYINPVSPEEAAEALRGAAP